MILTCPACSTKYVVKDGAIPAAGRQVRCASCKHSWHQDPELLAMESESADLENSSVAADLGGPSQPDPGQMPEPVGEIPEQAEADEMIAEEPQPLMEEASAAEGHDEAEWHPVTDDNRAVGGPGPVDAPAEPYAAVDVPVGPAEWQAPAQSAEEEFLGYAPIGYDEEPARRRWPLLLGLLVLIVAAAAAFWFLAPAEWKERAGIAGVGATPLQLMITTSDRQPLESGNELVAISGRVINPTDQEQNVPPIRAELRDKQTNAVVHRWTIAPPARVLAPRSSASFNSAEVDVPKGGDELTVTLGG
jgi:predicted Zn finger-like uncharacterized protein